VGNCDSVSRIFFRMSSGDLKNLVCFVGPSVNKETAEL
jgi:hypothetical protein